MFCLPSTHILLHYFIAKKQTNFFMMSDVQFYKNNQFITCVVMCLEPSKAFKKQILHVKLRFAGRPKSRVSVRRSVNNC